MQYLYIRCREATLSKVDLPSVPQGDNGVYEVIKDVTATKQVNRILALHQPNALKLLGF